MLADRRSRIAGWCGPGTFAACFVATLACVFALPAPALAVSVSLTVSTSGPGSGTVTGPGINCAAGNMGDCSETAEAGTVIVLTANPAPNSTYVRFEGAECPSSTCTVTLNADTAVDASFDLVPRTLTVSMSGGGSGTVSGIGIGCARARTADCSETVDDGTVIVLTANPALDSTFNAFEGAGCSTSPCSVTLDADKTVAAKFDPKPGAGGVSGAFANSAPHCDAVSAFATSEQNVTVDLACSDPDADALTYAIVAAPERRQGTVGSPAGSNVTFTPNEDYAGFATLSFTARDASAAANTETATIVVRRTCAGLTPTIVGGAGHDKLKGTSARDVIMGLGGKDTIAARGENDVVCGGSGNDRLNGGTGADRLLGGLGNDRLNGDAGADRLLGGSGRDILRGGAGKDALVGGSGKDRCNGGASKDTEATCES